MLPPGRVVRFKDTLQMSMPPHRKVRKVCEHPATAELEGARGEEQGGFKHTAAGEKNTCQKRDLL